MLCIFEADVVDRDFASAGGILDINQRYRVRTQSLFSYRKLEQGLSSQ